MSSTINEWAAENSYVEFYRHLHLTQADHLTVTQEQRGTCTGRNIGFQLLQEGVLLLPLLQKKSLTEGTVIPLFTLGFGLGAIKESFFPRRVSVWSEYLAQAEASASLKPEVEKLYQLVRVASLVGFLVLMRKKPTWARAMACFRMLQLSSHLGRDILYNIGPPSDEKDQLR